METTPSRLAGLAKIKKLERQLAMAFILLFILIISFLSVYDLNLNQEVLAITGNYSKNLGTELTVADWNNLRSDFVDASGDTVSGNLIVNGRIGLNNGSPSHELTVKDFTGGPSIYIWADTGKNAELALGDGISHWAIYSDEKNTDDLIFWRGNNRIIFTDDGNVGIGTAPTEKLQVAGNIKLGGTEGNIKDVDSIIGYNDLKLLSNFNESNPVYIKGSALNFYTNKIQQMTITSAGNVGIGVANPRSKLDVNGRIYGKLGSGVGAWTSYTEQVWDSCGNEKAPCQERQTRTCADGEYVCGVKILNDWKSDGDKDTVQLSVKCCKMAE